MKVKGVPPRAFIFMWPGFVYVVLTCSTGVCFGRANVFARESAMLKLPEKGENEASLPNLPVLKIKDGGYNSTSLNKFSPDQNRPALQVNLVPPYELRLGCRGGLGLHNESDRSRIIHRKK